MIGDRLLYMGLLVSLSATSAHAQTDLLWQHSDGRIAVWKMQGWVQMSGDLLNPGQLPDPRWQLVASSDFNLDGLINGDDYFLIDSNVGPSNMQLAAALAMSPESISGVSSVPEPASLGLVLAGSSLLLRRRR